MISFLALEFIIAFFISYYLNKKIINFSRKENILSRSDESRLKTSSKPRFGGTGIFFGFILSVGIVLLFLFLLKKENFINIDFRGFNLFFIAFFLIFLLGLIDDFIGLNAYQKLPVEILAATIVYFNGWTIKFVSFPFKPYNLMLSNILSYIITVIWIVGITNALNLIDGVDGLAGGITVISCISFAIIEIIVGKPEFLILLIPLVGAVLGFLKYNLYPAKIYLGDSGSLSIGFFLAVLSTKLSIKSSFGISFLIPIIILFIPIFDTILAFFRRIIKGNNPFVADNEHIHHKLLKKGHSEKKVFFILIGIDLLLSVLSVLSIFIPKQYRIIFLLILLILISIGSILITIYLKYININSDNKNK